MPLLLCLLCEHNSQQVLQKEPRPGPSSPPAAPLLWDLPHPHPAQVSVAHQAFATVGFSWEARESLREAKDLFSHWTAGCLSLLLLLLPWDEFFHQLPWRREPSVGAGNGPLRAGGLCTLLAELSLVHLMSHLYTKLYGL